MGQIRTLGVIVTLIAVPACASAQSAASVEEAANSIRAEDMLARIGLLAHDSMGGRNTPGPGLEKTARYIADEFRRLGLRPGGDDDSFIQRYSLTAVALDVTNSRIELEGGPELHLGKEAAYLFGRLGPETASGPVILVSGLAAAVEDSVPLPLSSAVVIYAADGGISDPATRRTVFSLYRQRPRALLVVGEYSEELWAFLVNQPAPSGLRLGGEATQGRPVMLVRARALEGLLDQQLAELGAGTAAGLAFQELNDVKVTIHLAQRVLAEHAVPNVVGILEGSDPQLKTEYIVFSAHMDHIGTAGEPFASCQAAGEDAICNGADDDASGTATVLEAAEAFAALDPRPRRSLIFLAVSGEEKGLLGSRYFTENPPVPLGQIVANLNSDMVGRNWRDTIAVIGKEHSDLGATLERVAASHPELNMTPVGDRWPGQRFYFRSDHYNFARRGVPILFFFNGVHDDYHQPSDEVEKIDEEKAARVGRLLFYMGLEIANAGARPQWSPESYREIVGPAATSPSQ